MTGTADGYYGSGTEDAVKAFEAAYGKTPTGIATSELQSYLYSDSAYYNTDGDVAVSYSVLSKGDSGSEVQKLQTRLKELNYLTGKCDGKYGAETVSAVKAFQKALGLKQTGTASAALQKELYSDDAPAKNSTTVVTVNKTAYVSVAKTNVYASINDSEPMATPVHRRGGHHPAHARRMGGNPQFVRRRGLREAGRFRALVEFLG